MKRKSLIISIMMVFIFASSALCISPFGKEGHDYFIYPIVRVSTMSSAGSGTVLYSNEIDPGKYSTYIMTNFHVVDSAITIVREWDSVLQKEVKKERRAIVYCEVFKYRNISEPVGTMKIEADIVAYNELEDMALLHLRYDDKVNNVAKLIDKDQAENYNVLDKSIAVGCSLAFPPLPTTGVITRKYLHMQSLPYHMSSSQIIYGNSGGAMFLMNSGEWIGIPSLVAVVGWGTPITHMGLFIPASRIYDWLEKEMFGFLIDSSKNEKESLLLREEENKKRKENNRE